VASVRSAGFGETLEGPGGAGGVVQEPPPQYQLGEEDEAQGGAGRLQSGQEGVHRCPQGEACSNPPPPPCFISILELTNPLAIFPFGQPWERCVEVEIHVTPMVLLG